MNPTVAIINATPASMAPAARGLAREFPEAAAWHLLDDRLVGEADAAGGMTGPLRLRMLRLIDHAVQEGADAVLLSCSMYGPVAALARQIYEVPVLGSDEAMFTRVVEEGPRRALVVGSLDSAVADSMHRLTAALGGIDVDLEGVTAQGAAAAAAAGDHDALLVSLVSAVKPHMADDPLVLLAQYSLTTADTGLQDALGAAVLSPPQAAARALRARLLGERP
ncbi:aspartate/glutamate racemase family protein [Actinomadura napierensis]|uniref:Asp/Glu racemase n=1 Tax=Actinomadura napierensis TaxID=267854 RepID=A0ABP5LD08_9ACTN